MPYPDMVRNIAAAGGGYEPQRVNNWTIQIDGSGIPNWNDQVIELSLGTFDPPSDTIEPLEIPYANENRKVAGRVTRDNVTLMVRDYVEQQVYEMLKSWQELVFDPTTNRIGWARDYKKSATLNQFDPEGGVIRQLVAEGVWPSKVSMNTLDQAGNDQVQITVDLVVDFLTI